MAKLDEKKKMLVVGGVALAISLLAVGGTWWAYGLIDEEQAAIAADEKLVEAAEAKIAKIEAAEKEVIILRENLDSYVKILPDDKDLEEFNRMLYKFVVQSGCELREVKPTRTAGRGKNAEQFEKTEYVCELTGSLWSLLKFLSLVENYERFVSVTGFTISSSSSGPGAAKPSSDGETVHGIKLTMEAFTYNGKAAGQDVDIPEYQSRREALRDDILRRQQAIPIERYDYRGDNGASRRDIFDDPRQRVNSDGSTEGTSLQEQKALIDRYVSEIARLRDILQKARRPDQNIFQVFAAEKEVRERVTRLEAEVEHVNEQKTISSGLRTQWAKNVVDALAELKTQLNRKDSQDGPRDPYLQKIDFEQLLADMKGDLEAGNLDDARTRYETVQDKIGVPLDDPRHELEVQVKAAFVKATTALAFKALPLDIKGVMVNHQGRSGVLLNNEVYEEGEYISDELLVKKVQEEQVTFVFRGLTIIRTL